MPRQRRKRVDSRTVATRSALIETAEKLFARKGFHAVSTRSIGAAIGSLNNTVVTYHFGSKDALIRAIFEYRHDLMETRRRQLLEEAETNGTTGDLETILMAMWLPFFEQIDDTGSHSYAGFLRAMMSEGMGSSRENLGQVNTVSRLLVDHIKDQLPFTRGQIWDMRWLVSTSLVLNALRFIDAQKLGTSPRGRELFHEAVLMAKEALMASQLAGAEQ